MSGLQLLSDAIGSDFAKNSAVIIGVIVAFISVITARALARKKQAADLLFSARSDKGLQDGYKHIRDHHDASNKNIRAMAEQSNFESAECVAIRYLLNHFEVMSIGIQNGIYDERMLKQCWYGLVIDTYKKSLPLIEAIREKNKSLTALQEFEWLAKRWQQKPLKARSNA